MRIRSWRRTHGVLRLMATVIHCLWEEGDKNPLIPPSTIPINNRRVQMELARYLSDNWAPIIERDVDGPDWLPRKIDAQVPNLGRLHATRRVARTISSCESDTARPLPHRVTPRTAAAIQPGCSG